MSKTAAIKKRIRDIKAFTLSETLVTIIIVMLVSSIVAVGIPAASNAYKNVVRASNAEILLSNTMISLRNELGMARDITVSQKKVTYYNPMYDSYSSLNSDNRDIKYRRFEADGLILDSSSTTNHSDEVLFTSIVSSETEETMHVKYAGVEHKGGVITFSGLEVLDKSGNPIGVKRDSYVIRVITE